MNPDQTPAAHLPATLPSPAALLQRTQAAISLLRDVVQESSAEYWYERGRKLFGMDDQHNIPAAKSRMQEAINAFDECLKLLPNHIDSLFRRANINYQLRNYTIAMIDYQKAIALDISCAEKCAGFVCGCGFDAYTWSDSDHAYRKAESDFSRALELNPNFAPALYHRGYTRYYLDSFEEAIQDYRSAINIKPDYLNQIVSNICHNGYDKLGWLGYSQSYSEAAEDFIRALNFRPNHAYAICGLGKVKYGLKDFTGSISDFDRAISIQPNLVSAFEGRALSKKALGDLNGSAADFSIASHLATTNNNS